MDRLSGKIVGFHVHLEVIVIGAALLKVDGQNDGDEKHRYRSVAEYRCKAEIDVKFAGEFILRQCVVPFDGVALRLTTKLFQLVLVPTTLQVRIAAELIILHGIWHRRRFRFVNQLFNLILKQKQKKTL